ncbi:hypothetical protein AR539_17800 [Arthrobacter sp. EPSL27]|nr:hypothetical protein AR539_17800 [Arthrobacter sp. EPSL27]
MVWVTNWLGLAAGAPVTVRRPGREPAVASVELATPDGQILWVRYWFTADRAMLHKADGTEVWCEADIA